MDGEYGAQALGKSAYYVKGSELRGFLLMLVFFLWGFVLRFSSLFFGWYEKERGVIVQVGLFCVGNVMKWVVCTVYFFDCEAQVLEKKFDKWEATLKMSTKREFLKRKLKRKRVDNQLRVSVKA